MRKRRVVCTIHHSNGRIALRGNTGGGENIGGAVVHLRRVKVERVFAGSEAKLIGQSPQEKNSVRRSGTRKRQEGGTETSQVKETWQSGGGKKRADGKSPEAVRKWRRTSIAGFLQGGEGGG